MMMMMMTEKEEEEENDDDEERRRLRKRKAQESSSLEEDRNTSDGDEEEEEERRAEEKASRHDDDDKNKYENDGDDKVDDKNTDGTALSLSSLEKNCIHELVTPDGHVSTVSESTRRSFYESENSYTHEDEDAQGKGGKRKRAMAKTFPFALDPFQLSSVFAIDRNENVLVAAHTSAGKTVVAEYAIATALNKNKSSLTSSSTASIPSSSSRSSKVIYTSPLKALSNQKFRELKEEFHDVGLLTGDISINPDAGCLVCTTEVLRSMLYRGSLITQQASWIIFDEVHYLRDKERGVAWEESIMLSPKQARLVFLSATIPNAKEFAHWVSQTHGSCTHVISTDYRPTPLQHFVYPSGGNNVYMILDERGQFKSGNFRKAVNEMKVGGNSSKNSNGKNMHKGVVDGGGQNTMRGSDMFKVIKLIMSRGLQPVIVFSFSKRDCEMYSVAMMMHANQPDSMAFADSKEQKLIRAVFDSAIDTLCDSDRKLPQITRILPLLLRGIGIHHGGMMPVLKEVTELLFQEGLLKVLFATETFSTGLNMPARTVVMTSIRKFDGCSFRVASSAEYIQMSGRAGRRGLDDLGVVIVMLSENMEPEQARSMLRGKADALNSAYHLTYHAMLNTMRAQSGFSPATLVQASFKQFQAECALPGAEDRVRDLSNEIDAFQVENEQQVVDYLNHKRDLFKLEQELRCLVFRSKYVLKFMQPGRLVRVPPEELFLMSQTSSSSHKEKKRSGDGFVEDVSEEHQNEHNNNSNNNGVGDEDKNDHTSDRFVLARECPWAVVVNIRKVAEDLKKDSGVRYMVDVLAQCTRLDRKVMISANGHETNVFEIVPVPLAEIIAISTIRIYLPNDLRSKEARQRGYDVVKEVMRRYPTTPATEQQQHGQANGNGIPCLDVEEDIKVDTADVRKLIRRIESAETRFKSHPLNTIVSSARDASLQQYKQKCELMKSKRIAERHVKAARDIVMRAELRARNKVLRRMQYVNKEGVVQLKGHVAAELSSGDELVLTELIMDGSFVTIKPEEVASFLSCIIHEERSGGVGGNNGSGGNGFNLERKNKSTTKQTRLRPELEKLHKIIRAVAKRVAETSLDCRLDLNRDDYISSFRSDMMEVMYLWSTGATFAQICTSTDTYEGSLVRLIRRVEELLRQLISAAEMLQDQALVQLFESAVPLIKRDIVFAPNLYL